VAENYAGPGPHYMYVPDKEAEHTVGNITGMIDGGIIGFAAGLLAGFESYNAINGGHITNTAGLLVWTGAATLFCTLIGGYFGWNIPYMMLGDPNGYNDAGKHRKELENKEDEKLKDLFKDKN